MKDLVALVLGTILTAVITVVLTVVWYRFFGIPLDRYALSVISAGTAGAAIAGGLAYRSFVRRNGFGLKWWWVRMSKPLVTSEQRKWFVASLVGAALQVMTIIAFVSGRQRTLGDYMEYVVAHTLASPFDLHVFIETKFWLYIAACWISLALVALSLAFAYFPGATIRPLRKGWERVSAWIASGR
jgi:hypothetical protein